MFTNNNEPPVEEESPNEPHMLGPTAEEEPPLMGLVGDITEEAAQQHNERPIHGIPTPPLPRMDGAEHERRRRYVAAQRLTK